jgi:Ankyrin repeats (3 copies)
VYQRAAGQHADVATLATAHKLGVQHADITLDGAAQFNKLAEVRYLRAQGCPWPSGLLENASSNEFFELLRWCYEHGCRFLQASAAPHYAAESGNIELMAWVLQQPGTRSDDRSVKSAAAPRGLTPACQQSPSQQFPWDEKWTQAAARGGHVALLRWLMDNGCPWSARELWKAAAEGGSVEVLAFLQQQGLQSRRVSDGTELLHIAACCNHLAAAQWLRQQGADWPPASSRSSWGAEVLQWAAAASEGFTQPSRLQQLYALMEQQPAGMAASTTGN